jgi:hypothetical protein
MVKWTFMVYLAGNEVDATMMAHAKRAYDELCQIGSNRWLSIVAQYDRGGNSGAQRYFMRKKGQLPRGVPAPAGSPANPDTLLGFIRWVRQHHRAQHYALLLLSHGCGWTPPGVKCKQHWWAMHSQGGIKPESICRGCNQKNHAAWWVEGLYYDGRQDSIDTFELDHALTEVRKTLGQKLDLLILDACLMSNMEVAYQLRRTVRFMVASALTSGLDWPYRATLETLKGSDRVRPKHFAKSIVEEVARTEQSGAPFSQAALNLGKTSGVAKSLRQLAGNLRNPGAMMKAIGHANKHVDAFDYALCDINSFCTDLLENKNGYIEERVRRSARKVCDALKPGDGNFMLEERHGGTGTRNFGGVTVYLPTSSRNVLPCYRLLEFAKDTGWKHMLDTLHPAA